VSSYEEALLEMIERQRERLAFFVKILLDLGFDPTDLLAA
jgi:hypothetical protein